MNIDIIKGKWRQLKGKAKQQWSKLTDDDLTRIEGNLDEAAGVIQERYGRSRDEARREWQRFCELHCRDERRAEGEV